MTARWAVRAVDDQSGVEPLRPNPYSAARKILMQQHEDFSVIFACGEFYAPAVRDIDLRSVICLRALEANIISLSSQTEISL